MNKHERTINRIIQHGNNLKIIFNLQEDSLIICKKLRRLEIKGYKIAEDYCNGYIDSIEKWEKLKNEVLKKVDKILNFRQQKIPVFFNGDPRGYCLKIEDNFIRDNNINIYKDFGGYGVIAPDLTYD